MKKILSVLLAVCLLVGALPMTVSAENNETYEDGNGFVGSAGRIIAYNGPGGDVVVPDDMRDLNGNGHLINDIAGDVFKGRSDITSITFPGNKTNRFFNTSSSAALDLTGCTSLENFYVTEKTDRDDGLTATDGILYNISSSGKTSLLLCPPNRTEVTIAASVTDFNVYAFDNCLNLERFVVEQGNPTFMEVYGSLYEKYDEETAAKEGADAALVRCPLAFQGEFQFPEGLSLKIYTRIVTNGGPRFTPFRGCTGITGMNIPATLKLSNNNIFFDCVNLKSFTVAEDHPNLFTEDGLLYFQRENPNTYEAPNSLVACPPGYQGALVMPDHFDFDYGNYNCPFENCSGITELTLNKISNFFESNNFFTGCDSLTNLYFNPDATGADPADEAASIDGVLYIGEEGDYYTLVAYPPAREGDFTVPNNVQYLARNAFRGRAISSITIPATVKNIWQDTFRDCPNLTKVDIAPMAIEDADYTYLAHKLCNCGLGAISKGAFQNCPNLSYVYIPETTRSIGDDVGRIDNIFLNSPNVTIYGAAGSKAEEYANRFEIPFNAVSLPSRPAPLPTPSPTPEPTPTSNPTSEPTPTSNPTSEPTPTPPVTDEPTPTPPVTDEPTPTPITFTDVPQGKYFYNPVTWAVSAGITGGTGGGKFSPDMKCTRAQIVTFLWNFKDKPQPEEMATFDDMTNNKVFNNAISWAVGAGITGGVGNNKFGPGLPCTRGQAMVFLWNACGKPEPNEIATFSDMPNSSVFQKAISWGVEQKITGGTGNNKFSPNAPCTRAQIVTFLYAVRDL